MTLSDRFRDIITQAMAKKDINRTDLAELLGVTKASVSQMLAKNSNLTLGTIEKIGKALGLQFRLEGRILAYQRILPTPTPGERGEK